MNREYIHKMFIPKKRLGQHFIIDKRVLEREAEYANIRNKVVLEIGGGYGNLTEVLIKHAKRVIVFEKDRELINILKDRFSNFSNIEIINMDFLKSDIKKVERIVSNPPYLISSPILFKLAEMEFEKAILCYQKEFAERLIAKPGTKNYSRLSVMAQLNFNIELLETVSRNVFFPKPNVDSEIVRLTKKKKIVDKFSEKMINILFQHKNKKVKNALQDSASFFGLEKKEVKRITNEIKFAERRVFALTQKEILSICKELSKVLNT